MAETPASSSGGGGGESGGKQSPQSTFSDKDRFLPIASINRIMKKALPENAKIAMDAKESVQECVSEFIRYITIKAIDRCQREKRMTINGDDLLWAMATLGFEEYVGPLKVYLQKYREMEANSKLFAKGGDSSARNDAAGPQAGTQPGPSTQGMGQQGSFTQGMNYMQPR